MSTCAGIAIKTEKGYKAIYCHSDGYPSYMLRMLQENYNSEILAKNLINNGDASCIKKELDPVGRLHSFDRPEEDVCVFYYRDRQQPWNEVKPEYFSTKKALQAVYYYTYVFADGCWSAYRDGKKVTIYL